MTTKREIVKTVAELSALTQAQTHEVVQLALDVIADTLVAEGRLELRRFGVFEVKQRKARKARDPRDGSVLHLPPRKALTFRPCKELERRIADS
ncbi:MAG: HU family DNA-binding protein [Planctomycetota bacterium]